MRKLIAARVQPGPLTRKYEDFLRGLTKETVDEALEAQREFDFVKKISADFPIQVLARLLDVPPEDTGELIAWGNQMIGNTDPDYAKHLLDRPGQSTSTSICRSGRRPCWRSWTTAGRWPARAGRRRHRPGLHAGQPDARRTACR